ncbi:MAG TPA: hypothetical protein VFZ91_07685 [Allosphingosinicella sp.]
MHRFLPFSLLALSGCMAGATERPLSVREVVENARTLDGREIVVAGWLERCQSRSCGIHASADEVGDDFPYYLSIGPSRWFDSFARRTAPTRIVLRARLHDRCISDPAARIIAACADRAGTLEALAVIR